MCLIMSYKHVYVSCKRSINIVDANNNANNLATVGKKKHKYSTNISRVKRKIILNIYIVACRKV